MSDGILWSPGAGWQETHENCAYPKVAQCMLFNRENDDYPYFETQFLEEIVPAENDGISYTQPTGGRGIIFSKWHRAKYMF